MTIVLIFFAVLAALIALYLRFLAVPAVWRWLRATEPAADPVWDRVRDCAAGVARRHRVSEPGLRVLPEFAPNALVLQYRGKTELGLTEGLVRSLGAEDLEATLSLCLFQSTQPGRRWQTWSGLLLFPFAKRVGQAPFAFRVFLTPVLSCLLRLGQREKSWFSADAAAAKMHGPWQVAATLQKLAVLGRKIPVRRWNLALDSLFVVAPLALDEGPQWLIQGQPSVVARRERLLAAPQS
jgi:Zn-dependent protease with chaperone function